MGNPTVGQKIYVPTSLYVYRGEDDFMGGVATIDKVEYNKDLPDEHFNKIMVGIEERSGSMYNYKALLEKQDDLKNQFGDSIAHPDPDDRPEFNDDNADWTY